MATSGHWPSFQTGSISVVHLLFLHSDFRFEGCCFHIRVGTWEVFQGFQYCHLYIFKDAIFLEGLTSLVFHSSGTIDLSPFHRSVRNFFFSSLKTKLSLCFFQTLCFFLQTLFAYLLSLPTLYFLPRPRFFRKKVRKSARLILHFLLSLTTSDPPTPRYWKYNYLFESGSIRNVC